MNRKATPTLFAAVLLLGLLAYFTEHRRSRGVPPAPGAGDPGGAAVLSVEQGGILQVRMKRDYWNSFTLVRGADGAWRLAEPSNEPAFDVSVAKLLAALEHLKASSVIDLPSDDSERHREYGLWSPTFELTVTTAEGDQTLIVGAPAQEGQAYYCARLGRDKVYVVPHEAVQTLAQDLAAYRQEKAAPSP